MTALSTWLSGAGGGHDQLVESQGLAGVGDGARRARLLRGAAGLDAAAVGVP